MEQFELSGIWFIVECKHVYTDCSNQFQAALDDLGLSHDTSTPHRPETNGVAERFVRKVKEGTSCTLSQSGLSEQWWGYAMLCFCFLANVVELFKNGKTAYNTRFDTDYTGPYIPFGAEIYYLPIPPQDK